MRPPAPGAERLMYLAPREVDLQDAYLAPFLALVWDRRTARLLAETVRRIVDSECLVCARSRLFPPALAGRRAAGPRTGTLDFAAAP